ncbi:MAG TPA: hypothetical protein VNV65_12185 [Candidatus Solibacter sp.]|nr:hypothetical protein [Candidatus Solibacter sp.]
MKIPIRPAAGQDPSETPPALSAAHQIEVDAAVRAYLRQVALRYVPLGLGLLGFVLVVVLLPSYSPVRAPLDAAAQSSPDRGRASSSPAPSPGPSPVAPIPGAGQTPLDFPSPSFTPFTPLPDASPIPLPSPSPSPQPSPSCSLGPLCGVVPTPLPSPL